MKPESLLLLVGFAAFAYYELRGNSAAAAAVPAAAAPGPVVNNSTLTPAQTGAGLYGTVTGINDNLNPIDTHRHQLANTGNSSSSPTLSTTSPTGAVAVRVAPFKTKIPVTTSSSAPPVATGTALPKTVATASPVATSPAQTQKAVAAAAPVASGGANTSGSVAKVSPTPVSTPTKNAAPIFSASNKTILQPTNRKPL